MKERGFTMIELIITIAILSFGIIGVYSAFSPMVSLQRTISSRFVATYLAQEGFEIVRNIRDNTVWPSGLTRCTLGCQTDYKTGTLVPYNEQSPLNIDTNGFYGYGQGQATPFKRKIMVSQANNSDVLKVVVTVMWDYNGKPFEFEVEGYLYNYK
jgi:prepilin-type N-terminal cleavage/methylation domain-containing protein